jgi:flagellar basal body rod protein FlgB
MLHREYKASRVPWLHAESVIANNLANSNTTGFKADRAAFQDLMYQNVKQVGAQSTQDTQYSTGLSLGTGVKIAATEKNYAQGSVLQTGGNLDMSVTGLRFFQITMPDGTLAYTRDGSFSLDSQDNRDRERVSAFARHHDSHQCAGGQPEADHGREDSIGKFHQCGRTAARRQQSRGRVGVQRRAAGRNARHQWARYLAAGFARYVQREHGNRTGRHEMNSKAISTTDQMLQYLTTNLA